MKLPSTISLFLSPLTLHNNRERFLAHKRQYDEIRADLTAFFTEMIGISLFDPNVRRETAKSSLFTFYWDIRFSPDKTSYNIRSGICPVPGGNCSKGRLSFGYKFEYINFQ
ncbi:MAG: DUF2461 family protein [Bacteroidales bacterium]|nr:DUF2461 family protein [Bacteroidales bacterium]